ncbi:uracil-DNA glycosylase [Massilia oculi]|uniref:Uracil-DNA glycosylase n=1 Tax=Massilia hydrophila TaxID=3044279 RepID=A0ABS7Y9T3_9BURK|nr:uracil-DNA glycosylase [Massilia oculi]MCA1856457.1 uracil-DNA glycosylase [Massilia oculi]
MKRIGAREAAFLAEMGIGPLWSLRAAPPPQAEAPAPEAMPPEAGAVDAGTEAAPAAPAPVQARPLAPPPMPRQVAEPAARQAWTPPAADTAPAAEPVRIDASGMDWTELRQAIATCRHCSACSEGRQPVPGAGATTARWLVAAGTASAADEQAGQPLTGEPGKLLDNMLQAVGMSRATDVYVTTLVKCRPANARGGERAPSAEEVAACRPFLERERELAGAALVLTLGQVAANGLRGQALSEPLAGSRGVAHRLGEVPMVATLHPAELLRRGADKALAWADLCLARRTGASGDGHAG